MLAGVAFLVPCQLVVGIGRAMYRADLCVQDLFLRLSACIRYAEPERPHGVQRPRLRRTRFNNSDSERRHTASGDARPRRLVDHGNCRLPPSAEYSQPARNHPRFCDRRRVGRAVYPKIHVLAASPGLAIGNCCGTADNPSARATAPCRGVATLDHRASTALLPLTRRLSWKFSCYYLHLIKC